MMLPYPLLSFLSVSLFSYAHLSAEKIGRLNVALQSGLLSLGGGIAIAYVFIDLLPKLAKSDLIVTTWLAGVFPYVERHAYIMALLGFLLFFIVGRAPKKMKAKASVALSLSTYALFNFLVGYAVVDKDNPEVRPLLLFTFALTLHFLVNDYTLRKEHPERETKGIMIFSLFLGWLTGNFYALSEGAVSLISAFIGGGVILNVTQHELPEENPNNLPSFLLGAILYAALLLFIGR